MKRRECEERRPPGLQYCLSRDCRKSERRCGNLNVLLVVRSRFEFERRIELQFLLNDSCP